MLESTPPSGRKRSEPAELPVFTRDDLFEGLKQYYFEMAGDEATLILVPPHIVKAIAAWFPPGEEHDALLAMEEYSMFSLAGCRAIVVDGIDHIQYGHTFSWDGERLIEEKGRIGEPVQRKPKDER